MRWSGSLCVAPGCAVCRGERPGDSAGPCRALIRACLPSCGWSGLNLQLRKRRDNRCVYMSVCMCVCSSERLEPALEPCFPLPPLRLSLSLSRSPFHLTLIGPLTPTSSPKPPPTSLSPDPGHKQFTLPGGTEGDRRALTLSADATPAVGAREGWRNTTACDSRPGFSSKC